MGNCPFLAGKMGFPSLGLGKTGKLININAIFLNNLAHCVGFFILAIVSLYMASLLPLICHGMLYIFLVRDGFPGGGAGQIWGGGYFS